MNSRSRSPSPALPHFSNSVWIPPSLISTSVIQSDVIRNRRRSCFLALLSRSQSALVGADFHAGRLLGNEADIHKLHHGLHSNNTHTAAWKSQSEQNSASRTSLVPLPSATFAACLSGGGGGDGCGAASAVWPFLFDGSYKDPGFHVPPAALAPASTDSLHCFQWQLLLLLKTIACSNGKKWV